MAVIFVQSNRVTIASVVTLNSAVTRRRIRHSFRPPSPVLYPPPTVPPPYSTPSGGVDRLRAHFSTTLWLFMNDCMGSGFNVFSSFSLFTASIVRNIHW